MEKVSIIPCITIHPNYIATHVESDRIRHHPLPGSISSENLNYNNHHGYISKSSGRKLKRAVNYMTLLSKGGNNYSKLNWKELKFKLTFVTLTLSSDQVHTDNYVKSKMLNQFLIEAKKHWEIDNYVWRAEKQGNLNVHFHIIFDKFIPWFEIRAVWNRIQAKEGYINRYRLNQEAWHDGKFKVRKDLLAKWNYNSQLKAYKHGVKSNWSNPNSTDIHSIRFINNVGAYICKYLTKDANILYSRVSRKIFKSPKRYLKGTHSLSFATMKYLRYIAQKGRLWSCSYSLTNITGATDVISNCISDELALIRAHKKFKQINEAYYNIICITIKDLVNLKCHNLITMFSEYIVEKFILSG